MDKKDQKILLKLARESISTYFDDEEPYTKEAMKFKEKQGCFVTLTKKGELRGCIGFPHPTCVLHHAIVDAARSAAFGDPRFPPVLREELDKIKIEISVLTKPAFVKVDHPEEYLEKIKIGRDGLIMQGEHGSGLLLPQVATEYEWNVTEFLNALSEKSGLTHDAWKELTNKIHSFQAEVFSE